MLILDRNIGEAVIIGNDIKVTIIGIERRKIRLAVIVPEGMKVYKNINYQLKNKEILKIK